MYKFSASMMCANPFKLESQIEIIDKYTDYYHIDIMDGHFVPNITLSLDYVRQLKKNSTKPIDVHLMVTNPDQYIDELLEIGVNCITFHIEAVYSSVFRLITKIKKSGCKVGFAISPSFTIDNLRMFLPNIDKVTVMTVEPGYAGQPLIIEVIPKIKEFSDLKKQHNFNYLIEVDGSNNFKTFDRYIENGAEISILGTALFNEEDLESNFIKIKEFVLKQKTSNVTLSIDIGGTFTRYGLIDSDNNLLEHQKISTFRNKDDLVKWIKEYTKDLTEKHNVKAIVIGYPGIVNQANLEIISLPNLSGLEGKDYLTALYNEIQIPIFVNKDTTHLLEYDIQHFNITDKNVLGYYLGTGFGHAMLLNGKIFEGDTYAAGEIGHINIFDNSVQCGCGQFGCSETKVSGKHLREIKEEHFANTEIDDLFVNHTNEQPIQQFISDLARTISISLNLLDVSTIVLGGGVFNMKAFPNESFEQQLKQHLRSDKFRQKLSVMYSKDISINGIIGGGLFFNRNGKN
ncbi:MAG: allose kinase [Erysipelotrichaceae bacterium]|nr:allose kinase [Erysipelotrichaceae bacterium]MDP3305847.1 allose kinase [Erysipelotrichaceae bacterium]